LPPRDVMRQMRPARTGIAAAWGWGVCIRAMGITFDLPGSAQPAQICPSFIGFLISLLDR